MPKMASDFLQSNLFNPTAPSEQMLERAIRRRIKGSNSELPVANRGGPFSIQVSRSPDHTLNRDYTFHCNNNNSYAFQNYNTYRNLQSKKAKGASPQLTQPMIKSMVREGLVKLPGPPGQTKPEFSGNAAVLATTARRDRVKNNCSLSSHQNLSIFSGTREILTEDNQDHSFYSHAHSLGQLFPKEANINLMNGTGQCIDDKSNDASRKNEECNEQSNDLIDISTRISPNETLDQMHKRVPQEDLSLEISVPVHEDESVSKDTKSKLVCNNLELYDSLHRFPDTRKVESNDQGSDNDQGIHENTALCDAFNLLQMKTELDKLNLINKYKADNASRHYASQDIDKSLFRETLESSTSHLDQNSEMKTAEIRVADRVTSPDEVAKEEIKPTNLAKKSKGRRKCSSKHKQLLRLLHLFFGIRLMKTTQKEDKQSLVEEEFTEGDGIKLELTSKGTKKKLRGNKHTFAEKEKIQENQNSSQGKDQTSTESTVKKKKKKKRRKPRKKNFVRYGRRLRKTLTKECRSIARDLTSISYMLPESYTCPRRFGCIPCNDYTQNDRINPNAPSWEGDKRYPLYDFC